MALVTEQDLAAVADVIADDLKAAEARLERLAARTTQPADWLRQTRAVEVLEYAGDAGRWRLKALTREATTAVGRIG